MKKKEHLFYLFWKTNSFILFNYYLSLHFILFILFIYLILILSLFYFLYFISISSSLFISFSSLHLMLLGFHRSLVEKSLPSLSIEFHRFLHLFSSSFLPFFLELACFLDHCLLPCLHGVAQLLFQLPSSLLTSLPYLLPSFLHLFSILLFISSSSLLHLFIFLHLFFISSSLLQSLHLFFISSSLLHLFISSSLHLPRRCKIFQTKLLTRQHAQLKYENFIKSYVM